MKIKVRHDYEYRSMRHLFYIHIGKRGVIVSLTREDIVNKTLEYVRDKVISYCKPEIERAKQLYEN